MTSLFLAERWSRIGDTVSAINCQLASLAAQNRQKKICCVVLKATEEEKKDAADCGVELILPCFNEHVLDTFKDDKPTSDWILSPETFFITLLELKNVGHIIEHIQSSTKSLISAVLRDRFFKHADIVLINHGTPSADLRQKYLKFAEAAEAVFSVGPTVFKEYNLIYRGHGIHINHLLYLPRPENDFFDLNVDQQLSEPDSVKQILSVITDKEVKCDKYKFLSAAVGQTAVALESVIGDIPKWFVRISSQADTNDTKIFLKNNLQCSFIEPNTHSLNSSQQHAINDLQQSNVLVIPPDEPFSMEALQAIAAGLPVLVPKRTATAEFLEEYFKADAEYFLYDPLVDGGLSKQINKMLLKSEQASHAILVLKSKLQSNSEVTATHENFKSFFMKHLQPSALQRKALIPESPISQAGTVKVTGRKRPYVMCVACLELEENNVKMENSQLLDEERQQKMKMREMLISEVKDLYELEKKYIIARNSPNVVTELYEAFWKFKARLDYIAKGSLQFMLSFLSEADMDYFWLNYEAERVEKILSGILITPKMRSLAEKAECTVRIRLKIDKREYEIVKEILHDMSPVYTMSRIVNTLILAIEDELSDDFKSLILGCIANTQPAFEFKVNSLAEFNMVAKLMTYYETFIKHIDAMGTNNDQVSLENITIVATECKLKNIVWDTDAIETLIHALSRLKCIKVLCLVGFNEALITEFLKIQSKKNLVLEIRKLQIPRNSLTIDIVSHLIESIKYYPFLEEIDLSQNYLGAVGCMALLELPNTVHVVVEHNGIEKGALGNEQHTTKVQSMENYLSLLNVSNIGQLKEKMAKVTKLEASALPHDVAKTLLTNISLFSELKFLNASACTKVEEPKYGESQFDISHSCISNVGARSVIGMLEKLTELEYLDLSKNNIGDVGAKTLSEIVGKLTKLTHLDLSDNCINDMDATSISNALKGAFQLQNLYLGHNSIGESAAESMSGSFTFIKCIKILDLSYADLRDDGVIKLSKRMECMNGMIKLSLKNNNFGNKGAEKLGNGMIYLKCLQHFDVCNNYIGSRGVAALCVGLKQCNKLTHLLLGHNRIGDEGVKHLSKNMVYLKDLEHFDISGNQIGDQGFKEVFKMLEHLKQLKHLDASHNAIADVGLKRLANNAHFLGNLQYLDLSHNAIEKTELVPLSQAMKYMKMLEKLDLSHNEMGTTDASYLCEALKDMKNLRWLQVEVAFKDIDIKVKEELYKEARRLNVEMDDNSKNTKGTKEVNASKPSHDERKAFVERQESFSSRTSTTSHESSCSSRGSTAEFTKRSPPLYYYSRRCSVIKEL